MLRQRIYQVVWCHLKYGHISFFYGVNIAICYEKFCDKPICIFMIHFTFFPIKCFLPNFQFFLFPPRFRFDIKDAPRFGRLERLRGHGKWASTKRFFSRQLEKGKVRYVHTKGNPSTDSFSFTVTVPANSGSGSNSGSIPGGGFMAYTEDTFKIDIISNIIRVSTKLLVWWFGLV